MGLASRACAVLAACAMAWVGAGCSSGTPADSLAGPPPWQADVRRADHGVTDPLWLARCAALRDVVKTHPSARLVFLGDSITAEWESSGAAEWKSTFEPDGAIDLGLTGDTTQNVLWRIGHGEMDGLHPALVVLLIGTNDIPPDWTVDEITRGILAVAGAVRHRLPGTPVMLLSLLPRNDSWYGAGVTAVDADLARSVLPSGVTYLDVAPGFTGAEGQMNSALYQGDLLHLLPAGYRILAARIQPSVDRFLAVRTR